MLTRLSLLASLAITTGCGTSNPSGAEVHPDASEACPAQPQAGSACARDAQSCAIEGTGTCDQPPAGGTCTCTDGTWACSSGCADGCPSQLPAEGAACTLATGTECRYYYPSLTRCTCTTNAFHCD